MNAIYSRPGEAWVLLGNAQAEPRQVHLKVDGAKLRNPISRFEKAETWLKGVPVAVNTRELNLSGLNVTVPADSLLLVRLTGPTEQN